MTPATYREVARLARGWARGLYPHPIPAHDIRRIRVGVGIYMACRADGYLLYVGSATRPEDPHGVASRIYEHHAARRARWRQVWVLPLHDDTPAEIVLAIEGQIIDLLQPPQNQRRHAPRNVPLRRNTRP